MNLHNVKRDNVDRCLHNLTQACNQGNYDLSEVLLAASEFLGRIIVDTCDTPISGIQMATVMEDHIKRTLQAGYAAKGYNMGPVELN